MASSTQQQQQQPFPALALLLIQDGPTMATMEPPGGGAEKRGIVILLLAASAVASTKYGRRGGERGKRGYSDGKRLKFAFVALSPSYFAYAVAEGKSLPSPGRFFLPR